MKDRKQDSLATAVLAASNELFPERVTSMASDESTKLLIRLDYSSFGP